jgi:hypothetical protein
MIVPMKTMLDPRREAEVRERIARLRPDAPALWGRMSAHEMLCHLLDSCRVALGEITMTSTPGPFRFKILRYPLVYWLPWPKGKVPTTPEFLQTSPEQWDAQVGELKAALDRFMARARDPSGRMAPSPAFGPMSSAEWSRLMYLHFDHHLRQFDA